MIQSTMMKLILITLLLGFISPKVFTTTDNTKFEITKKLGSPTFKRGLLDFDHITSIQVGEPNLMKHNNFYQLTLFLETTIRHKLLKESFILNRSQLNEVFDYLNQKFNIKLFPGFKIMFASNRKDNQIEVNEHDFRQQKDLLDGYLEVKWNLNIKINSILEGFSTVEDVEGLLNDEVFDGIIVNSVLRLLIEKVTYVNAGKRLKDKMLITKLKSMFSIDELKRVLDFYEIRGDDVKDQLYESIYDELERMLSDLKGFNSKTGNVLDNIRNKHLIDFNDA
jgi:hypothetical protein